MWTLVAIELKVVPQPLGQLTHAVVALQVDVFVFDRQTGVLDGLGDSIGVIGERGDIVGERNFHPRTLHHAPIRHRLNRTRWMAVSQDDKSVK